MNADSKIQFHPERMHWTFKSNQNLASYLIFRIKNWLRKTFFVTNATVFPSLVRKFRSLDLTKLGTLIDFKAIPAEMYQKPFRLDFRNYFYEISGGAATLDLINIYTVGRRYSPLKFRQDSYFLDPLSKFKDSWFGIFVLKNDDEGRGKRFILTDPLGDPSYNKNINPNGVEFLVKNDQKIICYNSFMNYENLSDNEIWLMFQSKFLFQEVNDIPACEIIRKGEKWLQFERHYETISALTDRRKTKMRQRDGIAAYIGIPDSHQYRYVTPWHKIILKGRCNIKYFHEFSAWLCVYYNGVAFEMTNGMFVDTWENSDLNLLYEKMFQNMEIGVN